MLKIVVSILLIAALVIGGIWFVKADPLGLFGDKMTLTVAGKHIENINSVPVSSTAPLVVDVRSGTVSDVTIRPKNGVDFSYYALGEAHNFSGVLDATIGFDVSFDDDMVIITPKGNVAEILALAHHVEKVDVDYSTIDFDKPLFTVTLSDGKDAVDLDVRFVYVVADGVNVQPSLSF